MDALVKLVLERLEKRMTSTATFMVTECNSYDEHILLQNQLISFAGIDYAHIRELMSDTLVPWVACLHRALAYDCAVTIRSPCNLIDESISYSRLAYQISR